MTKIVKFGSLFQKTRPSGPFEILSKHDTSLRQLEIIERNSPTIKNDSINESENSEYNDSPVKLKKSNDLELLKRLVSSYIYYDQIIMKHIGSPSHSKISKELEKQSKAYSESNKMIKNISLVEHYHSDS